MTFQNELDKTTKPLGIVSVDLQPDYSRSILSKKQLTSDMLKHARTLIIDAMTLARIAIKFY